MPPNEERLAAQVIDLSPLTRIGAQVCLKDIKCNSAIMLKEKTCATGMVILNKACNPQQFTTTFNKIFPRNI